MRPLTANKAPRSEDFRQELERIFDEAKKQDQQYVDVKAGDLHRRVGGYQGGSHRMPTCCNIMKKAIYCLREIGN